MTKDDDIHIRISASDKAEMQKLGIPFSRIVDTGLATLQLWIQSPDRSSCVYISTAGEPAPRPASASDALQEPAAHA